MSEPGEVGDSFDSMEWQSEGLASHSDSPEVLTAPPRPVSSSYTTVGSLRPATIQHFSAPNRIQRDGVGRRAPQIHALSRAPVTSLAPPPSEYVNQPHYGHSSQLHFRRQHQSQYQSQCQSQYGVMPLSTNSMQPGNFSRSAHHTPRSELLLNPRADSFNHHGQRTGTTGPRSQEVSTGLQVARNSFSSSSAANSHQAASSGTRLSQQSVLTGITSYDQATGDSYNDSNGYGSLSRGNLDQDYRFPPSGLIEPVQSNRLRTGHGPQIGSSFASTQHFTSNERRHQRSLRHDPLTFGPPGQRKIASAMPTILTPNAPWQLDGRNNIFRSVPAAHDRVTDTAPPEEIRQYYPNGFSNDITGQYTRAPVVLGETGSGMSPEENTNRWFRAGLRGLDMTANDHIAEMDKRNRHLDNITSSLSQIALDEYGNPLTLQGLVQTSEPLTIEEIVAMDATEVSARLLHRVFGNTLRLADQRPGPNNLAMLSRYAPGAPWTIDNSPQGNQSFFGEDWGPTPRRVGRDPRYHHFE